MDLHSSTSSNSVSNVHQHFPLVSCIMPTTNRPEHVSQSVRYFLQFLLVCFCLPTFCVCCKNPGKAIGTYTGKWYWFSNDSSRSFQLQLVQNGDSLVGQYCAVYDNGKRLDCSDNDSDYNIAAKIENDSLTATFSSFFNATNGEAILKMTNDSLLWYIRKYPVGGASYAPRRAVLYKSKQ